MVPAMAFFKRSRAARSPGAMVWVLEISQPHTLTVGSGNDEIYGGVRSAEGFVSGDGFGRPSQFRLYGV